MRLLKKKKRGGRLVYSTVDPVNTLHIAARNGANFSALSSPIGRPADAWSVISVSLRHLVEDREEEEEEETVTLILTKPANR